MILQLKPQYIQIVKDILKENIPQHQVLVFGSRITNDFKPHSDLDLCVLGDTPLSLEQFAHLRESFSDSDLPIRVDIVDWAMLTPEFRKIIKENSYPLDILV